MGFANWPGGHTSLILCCRIDQVLKNTKPDAISCQWESPSSEHPPETIVPETGIVAPVRWRLETVIQDALQGDRNPAGRPPGSLYVPASARAKVL